ncbi:MAG: fasciclin domain-containing protein [Planctomycetes bacterium]|nr:fasciclin domain-containing protein [Planctomycetota bacterium]NOG55781.1 fasciclin domain-containing protein [Planctomycetota bacterium]
MALLSATTAMTGETERPSIVDTAISSGSFTTLVAALQAANLVDALEGDGPFTVFAPTDDAFAALPAGTVEMLLKPENRDKLAAILTYHVVGDRLESTDVTRAGGAVTLNGQRVNFNQHKGSVMVSGATVTTADLDCSNGVIHVIDRVILPTDHTIADVAGKAGTFKTLLAAAKAAGLVDALTGDSPLTVFAPTDEAFAKLPKGTVETLLKPENKHQLAAILKYHIVSGRVYAADAVAAKSPMTLQGSEVMIAIKDGRLTVDGASIIASDLSASNGVVHVIDRVILPVGN